jgi:hypothetical protein
MRLDSRLAKLEEKMIFGAGTAYLVLKDATNLEAEKQRVWQEYLSRGGNPRAKSIYVILKKV